jgi:hypothetical protein
MLRGVSLLILLAFFSILVPLKAQAQLPTGCDPEYMDAIEARAFLGAQRRLVKARNTIYKPDSVLEYNCFEQFMPLYAMQGDQPIPGGWFWFSEEPLFWIPPPRTTLTMDNALLRLVLQAIPGYLFTNYGHTFLGGRAPPGPATIPIPGQYECSAMQWAWDNAHCLNLFDEPLLEGFYTFEWYAVNEPRQIPNIPPFLPACAPADPRIADAFDVAYNGDALPYTIQNPLDTNPADVVPYLEDPYIGFVPEMEPGNCGNHLPIATGVIVNRITWNIQTGPPPLPPPGTRAGFEFPRYRDAVCPNPNCYYVPAGDDSGADPTTPPGGTCTQ